MSRSHSSRNRGFTLVELLVALLVSAIAVGIPIVVLGQGGHGFSLQNASERNRGQLDTLQTQLHASAHSSAAMYIPTSCGGAGSGDGTSCTSVRFYAVDQTGTQHFWGWDYSAGTQTLTQCRSYGTWNAAACPAGDTGTSISGVANFNATPRDAVWVASNIPNAGAVTDVETSTLSSAADPTSRVVGGNRIIDVQVQSKWGQFDTHLLPENAPFNGKILAGLYNPPGLGSETDTISWPNYLWFYNSSAAAQSFTATETNYGQYEPYIAQPWWTVASCPDGTVSWVSQVAPNYSDTATFNVTPGVIGLCTATVSTQDQTSGAAIVTAGPLTALENTGSWIVGSSITVPASGMSYGSVNLGAGKTYDISAINLTLNAGTCASYLTFGSFGATQMPGSFSTTYDVTPFTITGKAAGSCTFSVTDQYGESVSYTVTVIAPLGPMTFAPSVTLYPVSGTLTPTSATITASQSGYSGSFSITGNTCGAYVGLSGFSGGGPTATLVVTGETPEGGCTITATGGAGATASATVIVLPDPPGPTPSPSPTPAVPTITGGSESTPSVPWLDAEGSCIFAGPECEVFASQVYLYKGTSSTGTFAFQESNGTTPTCGPWAASALFPRPAAYDWIDVWDTTTGHVFGEPGQTGVATAGYGTASAEASSYYVQAAYGGNNYIVFSLPSTTDTYDIWAEVPAGGLILESAGSPIGSFSSTFITNVSGTGLTMSPLQDLGTGTDTDWYSPVGLGVGFTCNP